LYSCICAIADGSDLNPSWFIASYLYVQYLPGWEVVGDSIMGSNEVRLPYCLAFFRERRT
jgi:hypothetical protein